MAKKPFKPEMSLAFISKHNGIARALTTHVHIGGIIAPGEAAGFKKGAPVFNAIWDTGATNTVITGKVVAAMGLFPVGIVKTHTVSGVLDANVYIASIFLPNRVAIPNVQVTEGNLAGADVLIGMDIITQGDFAVSNRHGQTWFTFRIPSLQRFNFLDVPVQTSGRCSCGSGKEYPNCCGKNPQTGFKFASKLP